MYTIEVRPPAEADIIDAFTYYDKISEELGQRFKLELNSCFDRIEGNPLLFQYRYQEIKVAFFNRFPFGIHYTIKGNNVVVLALLHTGSNPKKWFDRL